MKIIGLDGKKYNINLSKKVKLDHKSQLHLRALDFIKDTFPGARILQEIYLPGSDGLYLDFLLPLWHLAFESHGEQHYKYNTFFYKNYLEFIAAQNRDKQKLEWCKLNNITLIELPHLESNQQWLERLKID